MSSFKKLKRCSLYDDGGSLYDDDDDCSMEINMEPCHVQSLGDMAAMVAAQYFGCDDFEKTDPPMDELLLKKVARWAFPQNKRLIEAMSSLSCNFEGKYSSGLDWHAGQILVENDKVREMWQVGFMATAYIKKSSTNSRFEDVDALSERDVRVSLTFEKHQITSSFCSECNDSCWCKHVIAAILYRMDHSDKVPVHAPVTEILSTLSRDQLQKLLQYTINGDPAGILGKVFSYVDTIRDSSSEINKQVGAPDPTFGGIHGDVTQWEATKENFAKSLKWLPKNIDQLHEQLKTLQQFGKNKEVTELYMILLPKLIEYPRNRYYGHELTVPLKNALSRTCNSLTCFLMSPNIDRESFDALMAFLDRIANKSKFPDLFESEWAQLPSLSLCFPKIPRRYLQSVIQSAACTKYVDEWSPQLMDLLNGKVDAHHTTYNENIVIMLARLETLFQLSDKNNKDQILCYLEVILRTLAKKAYKYSILGKKFTEQDFFKMFDIRSKSNQHNLTLSQENQPPPCEVVSSNNASACRKSNPSKSNKKPRLSMSDSTNKPLTQGQEYLVEFKGGKKAIGIWDGRFFNMKNQTGDEEKMKNPKRRKKLKTVRCIQTEECVKDVDLSLSQIAYALLHCLDLQNRCEIICKPKMSRHLNAAYCWLALELSRERTFESTLTTEHVLHLENCEDRVILILEDYYFYVEQEYLFTEHGRQDIAFNLCQYWNDHGFDFYNGKPPVVMVYNIVKMATDMQFISLQIQNNLLVKMIYHLLSALPGEYGAFIVQSEEKKNFYFTELIGLLFRLCDIESDENFNSQRESDSKMLSDVIMKLLVIHNLKLLRGVVSTIKKRAIMLKSRADLCVATLHFLLHTFTVLTNRESRVFYGSGCSNSSFLQQSDLYQLVLTTVNLCQLSSLKVIAERKPNFKFYEFVEILLLLQPNIPTEGTTMQELCDVITLCLAKEAKTVSISEEKLLKFNLSFLLDFYVKGSDGYNDLLQKVLRNADHIDYVNMFEVAKAHIDKVSSSNSSIVIDDITLEFVDKALLSANKDGNKKGLEIVQWAFDKCSQVLHQVTGEKLFTKLLVSVVMCDNMASVPLFLLENKTSLPDKLAKKLTCLNDVLISGYKFGAEKLIFGSNSHYKHYIEVIDTLKSWRGKVEELLGNSYLSVFNEEVFIMIGTHFHSKKRLISMLCEAFPDVQYLHAIDVRNNTSQ